jgi:hypothetical protein
MAPLPPSPQEGRHLITDTVVAAQEGCQAKMSVIVCSMEMLHICKCQCGKGFFLWTVSGSQRQENIVIETTKTLQAVPLKGQSHKKVGEIRA